MNFLEIEVKFYLNDIKPIRDYLLDNGAVSKGRFFESNIRFEDADKGLSKHKSLLRLRKDEKTTLTYKSKPLVEDDQFKMHNELEVFVSDFDKMKTILEMLGFHQEQIYEKWRETFLIDKTMVCIDQMPFGNFLEIEGEMTDIKNFAHDMSLSWERRITLNYYTCIFCGNCSDNCTTEKGIKLSNQWDLAGLDREAMTETHEFELQLCEKCDAIIGTKKHLVWLCEKLGPLAYTNPSLLIAKSGELLTQPQSARQESDEDYQPSDFMRILCPKCKCQLNIRL